MFVLGAGASADAPARISTFRGSATESGSAATQGLVAVGLEVARREYPKSQWANAVAKSTTWQSIFSEETMRRYPKIVEAIAREMLKSTAGRPVNLVHRAIMHLAQQKPSRLQRVITMNLDNLEFAAGLDVHDVMLYHGSAFIGKVGGRIVEMADDGRAPAGFLTSVVVVNGQETVPAEMEFEDGKTLDDVLAEDMKDSCLVFVGVSGSIVPKIVVERSRPRHVVFVNDKQSAVDTVLQHFADAKNKVGKDKVEVFSSVADFARRYAPQVPLEVPVAQLPRSNSPEALRKAREWFEFYAADFPFYE